MNVIFEEDIRKESLKNMAEKILISARTAPKAKGIDNLAMAYVDKDVIEIISDKMKEMYEINKLPETFINDSKNILSADILVLIGTKINPIYVTHCGLCGFKDCNEKNKYPNNPCAYNTGDLGIAIGSAVSVAMDARVDNRIMRTVGKAVQQLKLLGEDIKIVYGIPLSSNGKNPFLIGNFK